MSALPRVPVDRWVPVAIGLLSLCATLGAFWSVLELSRERRDAHFERETGRVVQALVRRMELYEDALQAGVAVLDANGGRMDRAAWRRFAQGLDLQRRYPGVNGIGLVARVAGDELGELTARVRADGEPGFVVHPSVDADVHLPIVYIEPVETNRPALGLDLVHERARREGAETALRSGRPRVTAPIDLVQDAGPAPGFLFYTPYRGPLRWPGEPDAFDGLVYAPFVVHELVEGALDGAAPDVELRIVDAGTTIHDGFERGAAEPGGLAKTVTLPMHGREWELALRATDRFSPPGTQLRPAHVLVAGLVIDAMILGLFFAIARAQRELRRSAAMGAELATRTQELEQSNRELERFACVVSHDLKTPLRGIGDLVWYLEEDLEPLVAAGTTHPDVPRHLERIGVQTRRMDALIDGILDYSGIGQGAEERLEAVDVAELLDELAEVHATHPGQIVVTGPVPTLETSRTRLEQVLGNLVGNAFKYHHEPGGARVELSFERRGESWRIRVADDGPGIDPRYHERIFEIFQTLRPKDAIDSTGVGLAIVRRTAEHVGGAVRVESVPGEGATFVVDWPARTLSVRGAIGDAPEVQPDPAPDDTPFHDTDLRKAA